MFLCLSLQRRLPQMAGTFCGGETGTQLFVSGISDFLPSCMGTTASFGADNHSSGDCFGIRKNLLFFPFRSNIVKKY